MKRSVHIKEAVSARRVIEKGKMKRKLMMPWITLKRFVNRLVFTYKSFRDSKRTKEIISEMDKAHKQFLKEERRDNTFPAIEEKVRRDTLAWVINSDKYGKS